jgi:hypothetical protein
MFSHPQAACQSPPKSTRRRVLTYTSFRDGWKYVVRRRLTSEKRGSFVLAGSNFFTRPIKTSDAAWTADINILTAEHRKLREVVAKISAPSRARAHMIRGAAAHDLYHAGQIRLLRRLCPL